MSGWLPPLKKLLQAVLDFGFKPGSPRVLLVLNHLFWSTRILRRDSLITLFLLLDVLAFFCYFSTLGWRTSSPNSYVWQHLPILMGYYATILRFRLQRRLSCRYVSQDLPFFITRANNMSSRHGGQSMSHPIITLYLV